ncbi:TRAP transporter substrate-binding protein DctP [Geomicrobium sp. JCM 19038]|uniref:TRAP transporter substrate-binding protein DctP n=1 Tax=Geomicrobium sp. JCM 19038 TaxID=1460635 RepID=UPI00045F3B83|nr:TRAP transporter substrate-binding protein DctP [Geomicrobium sp. JCM 19038]GAK08605.1 TRAP transporter solute receptor, unknown substrate 3 [Geomicrobium sp. JCM 19038]
MMLRRKMSVLLISLTLILASCVQVDEATTTTDGEEPIELTISSLVSSQNGWWQGFFSPWMEDVEERTDGKVVFDAYTSRELVPTNEELQALRNGTIDIAAPLWPLYDPKRFPLTEVTVLPLLESDTVIAARAFADLIYSKEPITDDGKTFTELEYGEKDLKVIPYSPTQQYVMSTKDYPLETVEDFRQASLRSPTRIHEIFAGKIGVNSVSIPSADMFDAINRGAFEGAFFSVADWTGYGMQEVFNYTLEGINLGHFSGVWAMTEENWNSLPEEVQQVMVDTAEDHLDGSGQIWEDRAIEIREEALNKGAEFVHLEDIDEDAQQYLINGMVDTWHTWIDEHEQNGLPAREVAILWRDLIIKHGGDVPDEIKAIE